MLDTLGVVMAQPAAGGGRWVSVAPERLMRWVEGFAERHGVVEPLATSNVVGLSAADGSIAECHVPFPPLALLADITSEPDGFPPVGGVSSGAAGVPSSSSEGSEKASPAGRRPVDHDCVERLIAHACRERRIGVLLVRLGGYAAGLFEGERLITSKVGSRQVHGRSAAGGWSQQRFARRREKQSSEALRAAADVACRVLMPYVAELEAIVLGGDRRAVDELRADRRLGPLFAMEAGPFLTVPDPRLAVLESTPKLFRAVRIRVVDP